MSVSADNRPTVPAEVTSQLARALGAIQIELKPWATAPAVHYMRGLIEPALSAYETALAAIAAQPATTPAPDTSAAASAAARGTQQHAHHHDLTAQEWVERAAQTLDERTRTEDDSSLLDAYDDLRNALEVMKRGMRVTDVGNTDGPAQAQAKFRELAVELQARLIKGEHAELVANVTKLANAIAAAQDDDASGYIEFMGICEQAMEDWLHMYHTPKPTIADTIRRVRQYLDDLPQDDQAVTETHLDELRLLLGNGE